MKILFTITVIFISTFSILKADVTISNGPTSAMVFIGNTWEPTAPVANLNIGDLLITLAGGPVTVVDFTPAACVGPLVINDPIIYNSGFALTLNSCLNLLVYNIVENQSSGDINLTSAGAGPGTGYVIVGTNIIDIPGITNGQYAPPVGPPPIVATNVHVGSLSGMTSVNAPFLIGVMADARIGEYAQIGLPLPNASGPIITFSGQSYAIASNDAPQAYGRIGHGNSVVNTTIGGNIQVVNENGNMFIRSFTSFNDADAAVGHINNNNQLQGNIDVTIEGSPGNGNILIETTSNAPAHIGHFLSAGAGNLISGSISVRARNELSVEAGICITCDAYIGHNGLSTNTTNSSILVEAGNNINLRASAGKSQIGHREGDITGGITVACGQDLSHQGGSNGSAVVGHNGTSLQGDIDIRVGQTLLLQGGDGGEAALGHISNTLIDPAAGNISVIAGNVNLLDGPGVGGDVLLGHDTNMRDGLIDVLTAGNFSAFSAKAAKNIRVMAKDEISIKAGNQILLDATNANAIVESEMSFIDLQALEKIDESQSGGGATFINPFSFFSAGSGDDIFLVEGVFPSTGVNLGSIVLEADKRWNSGDLWTAISYNSLFLPDIFSASILGSNSPIKNPDGLGAAIFNGSSSFLPLCTDLTILSSATEEDSSLPSVLVIGNNGDIDPSSISGTTFIGDVAQAVGIPDALTQSYGSVELINATYNAGLFFLKSTDSLNVDNSNLTSSGNIIMVADNRNPMFPLLGVNPFQVVNSTMSTAGGQFIQLYSASRSINTVMNSTFNGANFNPCANICPTEEWVSYYPGGTPPAGGGFRFYYKETPGPLALDGYNYDIDCKNNHLSIINYNPIIEQFSIYILEGSHHWQWFGNYKLREYDNSFTIKGDHLLSSGTIKIVAKNSEDQAIDETLININCEDLDLKVYPNPASESIYVETSNYYPFEIFNISGQRIQVGKLSTGENKIDLDVMKPGIYYLVINSSNVRKVVVE